MTDGSSSRSWAGRLGSSRGASPGTSLPPGMQEPKRSASEEEEQADQSALKDEQLLDGIERRHAVLGAIRSGAELERCESMLQTLGGPENYEERIAALERRVHHVGKKRPSLFGGFHLGSAREERELRDLIARRDAAASFRDRAERLRRDPDQVARSLELEIARLEARLQRLRERRRATTDR